MTTELDAAAVPTAPLPVRVVIDWPVGADPIELQDALSRIGIVLRTDEGDGDGDAREIILAQVAVLDVDIPAVCRDCGCTDERACDPPCAWLEEDLCTACGPDVSQAAP